MKNVIAKGTYKSNPNSATVSINGTTDTFVERRECGFFTKLAKWINNRFSLGAVKPTISICGNDITVIDHGE